MADIRDTIAKLLNLADSPNENEARTALLKARELMAKHKLTPQDIGTAPEPQVIKRTVGITCTKMTDAWAVSLSVIIATHSCCKAYRSRLSGSKTTEIGFIGLADDFALCERIFKYSYNFVKHNCNTLKKTLKKSEYAAGEIRKMCNAYGIGFCAGLLGAYREQDKAHQEWGLVLKTPPAVEAASATLRASTSFAKIDTDGPFERFRIMGFRDGQAFDPER